MKCPNCRVNPANHSPIGIMICDSCQEKRKQNSLPNVQVEMVGNSIKSQRKEYAKDIIQPFRAGELSKEYLDIYGTKGIKASEKEIKNAKNVWH